MNVFLNLKEKKINFVTEKSFKRIFSKEEEEEKIKAIELLI